LITVFSYIKYLSISFSWGWNCRIVDIKIKPWSPSYADLRINLIPIITLRDNFNQEIKHTSSKFKSAHIRYRDQAFKIINNHRKVLISICVLSRLMAERETTCGLLNIWTRARWGWIRFDAAPTPPCLVIVILNI